MDSTLHDARVSGLKENIPERIKTLKQWTPTYPARDNTKVRSKRPFISTRDHARLMTLDGAVEYTSTWATPCNYGIVTLETTPLAILDVDGFFDPATGTVASSVSPKVKDIIEVLAAQTYTERSLSGTGLHLYLYIEDKPTDRAYIKAKQGWSGQLSLHNNFMVCTGDTLEGSPATVLTIKMLDIRDLVAHVEDNRPMLPVLSEHADMIQALKSYVDHGTPLGSTSTTSATASGTPSAPDGAATEADMVWEDMRKDLTCLTLDRNPRVVRAWESVTQSTYEHYDYWLSIGMAIHFEARRVGGEASGMRIYLDWSLTDPTSYKGQSDVLATWLSFSDVSPDDSSARRVTYSTIRALVRRLAIPWADIDGKTGLPDKTSLLNMTTLLKHYGIRAYNWPGEGYFLDGDVDIVTEYFSRRGGQSAALSTDTSPITSVPLDPRTGLVFDLGGPWKHEELQLLMASLAQRKAQWKGKHSTYSTDMTALLLGSAELLNPTKKWLDTPPDKLPECLQQEDNVLDSRIKETSTFDTFMQAFKFPDDPTVNVSLIRKMLKAMLMQIVRFADPTAQKEASEGMVILVGAEGCRKTTFFQWLYPESLSGLWRMWTENVTSDKNKRDLGRTLAGAGLLLLDECDSVLKGGEVASWLKAVLTQNTISYTEIYAKEVTTYPRTALICGTTNTRDLWLSSSDNRRMWLIDVEYIDIEYLRSNISRYWLYKNLYEEFKEARKRGERPWIMDPKDFLAIRLTNETMSSKSSLQMDLEDHMVLPVGAPVRTEPMGLDELNAIVGNPKSPDHPHVYTTQQIKKLLRLAGEQVPSTAQLKFALRRISENWTGRRKLIKLSPLNAEYIYKGGEIYFSDRKAWLLPEWRDTEGL